MMQDPASKLPAMNQLKPSTVYIPVSVQDELPKELNNYHVISKRQEYIYPDLAMLANKDKKNKGWYQPGNPDWNHYPLQNVTHWLKEQSLYVFTSEELERMLGEVFESGYDRGYADEAENGTHLGEHDDNTFNEHKRADYIKSLLP